MTGSANQGRPATASGAGRRWRFGRVEFDERSLRLSLGGKPVELDLEALQILLHLLEHTGELVSTEQLGAAVWPGRTVGEASLLPAVARLRAAIGDEGGSIIRGGDAQGYRLATLVGVETLAAALPEAAGSGVPQPAFNSVSPPRGVAERRQLTVLFCDLVGSTQLSEGLDEEAFREVLLAYYEAATAVSDSYEGYVAQRLGDGLLIYFGYPAAHDEDAERAVRCGYDMVAAVGRLDYQPPLAVRIGIHTGPVVVGDTGGSTDILALGATVNLAARLQSLAPTNTVVISETTFKLVPGLFITRDLGTPELKGISRPVRVHQVIQPSGVRTRLEAADQLTPYVGREPERALLLDRWHQAVDGRGQACLITAEPGLGKSRLLLMLRQRIEGVAHSWLECRASPLTRNRAYQPVIELMHRGLVMKYGDSNAARLQRLEQGLDDIGMDRHEAVPLLAPLLGIDLPAPYVPSSFGPELKRRKTLDLLSGWLLALAATQPLLLVIEDLHWADASTLSLIGRLLEQLPARKLMLVMTGRPEFSASWPCREHLTPLTLQPLKAHETERMLDSLTGSLALPGGVREKIIERANGVPLFIEEITKQLL
jgi:class 3 adenylate cyclase